MFSTSFPSGLFVKPVLCGQSFVSAIDEYISKGMLHYASRFILLCSLFIGETSFGLVIVFSEL
jgi:hypothetical protein